MSNDLHVQYETLRRRGMPEHPRLEWPAVSPLKMTARASGKGWWYVDQEGLWSLQHDDDARDLITLHALRWFGGLSHIGTTTPFSVAEFGVGGRSTWSLHWCFHGDREPRKEVGHKTILDAIAAATAGMEPK
jgi:hypothetical protein